MESGRKTRGPTGGGSTKGGGSKEMARASPTGQSGKTSSQRKENSNLVVLVGPAGLHKTRIKNQGSLMSLSFQKLSNSSRVPKL